MAGGRGRGEGRASSGDRRRRWSELGWSRWRQRAQATHCVRAQSLFLSRAGGPHSGEEEVGVHGREEVRAWLVDGEHHHCATRGHDGAQTANDDVRGGRVEAGGGLVERSTLGFRRRASPMDTRRRSLPMAVIPSMVGGRRGPFHGSGGGGVRRDDGWGAKPTMPASGGAVLGGGWIARCARARQEKSWRALPPF